MKTLTQQPHLTSPKGSQPIPNPSQREGSIHRTSHSCWCGSYSPPLGEPEEAIFFGSRRGLIFGFGRGLLFLFFFATPLLWKGIGAEASAQNVGISATGVNPHNSAMLDVTSTTKGMLIPRMTGDEKYAIPSPATGLLIFQTPDTAGFWYYNGTKWIPLLSSTSSTSGSTGGWGLSGNGNTSASNFLGTTDNVSLRFRTNNTEKVIIDNTGRVGIGTMSPAYRLHVTGGQTYLQNTTTALGNIWQTQSATFRDDRSVDQYVGGGVTFEGQYKVDGSYSTFGWIRGFKNSATPDEYQGGLLLATRAGDMIFKTIGASGQLDDLTGGQSMIIKTTTGNVGIGTPSPSQKLHVASATSNIITSEGLNGYGATLAKSSGTNTAYAFFYSGASETGRIASWNDNTLLFCNGSSATERMRIDASGNMGIGAASTGAKLYVSGNICYTGSIGTCSDLRYKKDITPLPNALSNVMKLQGVNYNWKTDAELKRDSITNISFSSLSPLGRAGEGLQLGFIAQEIEKIIPEVVITDKDGYKSVDYSRLTPVLVEAIKEQQKIIENMQLANSNQQKAIDNQEKKIDNQQLAIDKLKQEKANSELRIAKLEAAMEKLMQAVNTEEVRK